LLGISSDTIPEIVGTSLFFLDSNIFRDADDDSGFYIAAIPSGGPAADWRAVTVFVSEDEGVTWTVLTTLDNASTGGHATTVLAAPSCVAAWDMTNTVTVNVGDGTLSNSTRALVYEGANTALLGDEIISFVTATDNSDGTYTLSELIRGRRGTDHALSTHILNESFVLLEENNLARVDQGTAAISVEKTYLAVTAGSVLEGDTVEDFTNTANGLRPYAVARVRASRDGPGEITLTWNRRSRIESGWDLSHDSDLNEDSESYEIDVYDTSFTTFKRTLSVSAETATYTVADQTTDFGSTQTSVGFRFYQLNATVGRGWVKQAVL